MKKDINTMMLQCEEYGEYYCTEKCDICGWNKITMHEKLSARYGEKIATILENTKIICSDDDRPSKYLNRAKTAEEDSIEIELDDRECNSSGREYCNFECSQCGWNGLVEEKRLKKMKERQKQNG